ncbi:SHOCT domain-containing protein [Pseudodesulfovibrio sp.]|uniref:SHOCT domain-containing protein n=1 Tax=unclassified Pseudodesulfovibrio TaxID=2661612 RepID=UPI003B001B41
MDFSSALTFGCGGPGPWHGFGGGSMGFFPFHLGGLIPLLLIGLVIYLALRARHTPSSNTGAPTPQEELKRRYAAGEIDRETFKQMKEDLK